MGEIIEVGVSGLSKLVTVMAENPTETAVVGGTLLGLIAGYGMGYKDGRDDREQVRPWGIL